jgi:hypothetical protein
MNPGSYRRVIAWIADIAADGHRLAGEWRFALDRAGVERIFNKQVI